jgi:mycothiol synthase
MTGLPTPPLIPGVAWRPAERLDASAIADLQDACYAVDGGYRETASEIAERFESPMTEASTDSLVGVLASGSIIVSLWSNVLPNPTTVWSVYDDNYVHPSHRSDEIRRFALDWWQTRGVERVEASQEQGAASLPVRFHQHVYPNQLQHIEDITNFGFEPWIYFDELRRDLSLPIERVALPDGYAMVPSADVSALELLAVRNDAFRDHRGSQLWTIEMWDSQHSEMYWPSASFAILRGTEAVAFVKCSVYPHDAVDRGYTEGWIEQVGTKRAHRGQRLAGSLIQAAMRRLASEGIEYATLEVDTENPSGAHGLYARLGFERVRGYVDYTRVVSPHVRTAPR